MQENWVIAYRFPSMDAAKTKWEKVRDLILVNDCDASVYRSQINGTAHVVIVGWQSVPESLRRQFREVCTDGELAEIPLEVRSYLIERRNRTAIPGAFWERRGLA